MIKDTEQTIVVFRKYKDGQILALFPEEKYSDHGNSVMSYMHVGQHSGADYTPCIGDTKPANPEEYQSLKSELEGLGYNLKVRKRYTRK